MEKQVKLCISKEGRMPEDKKEILNQIFAQEHKAYELVRKIFWELWPLHKNANITLDMMKVLEKNIYPALVEKLWERLDARR